MQHLQYIDSSYSMSSIWNPKTMWDCGFVCSAVAGLDISPEGALFTDDDVHEGIAINKDLFLLVIQDTELRHVVPA